MKNNFHIEIDNLDAARIDSKNDRAGSHAEVEFRTWRRTMRFTGRCASRERRSAFLRAGDGCISDREAHRSKQSAVSLLHEESAQGLTEQFTEAASK